MSAGPEAAANDADEPQRPFGARALEDWRGRRLTQARTEYSDFMNRLWAGNGAGAIASVSLIADAAHHGKVAPIWWLASPTAFMLGLLSLCAGSVIRLVDLRAIVRDLEDAQGIMDVHMNSIRRPSHDAGLHWADPRTVCGGLSALLFVTGVLIGLAAIYQVSFAGP